MTPDAPRARSFRFPRSFRLRRRPDFLRVQRRGRRQVYPDLVAVFRHRSAREAAEPVRVGFTVSKKVGNAVTRNRVKRQLREAVRHRLHQLTALGRPVDVVFIARSGAANAPSARLHAQVDAAFARIGDWTNRPTGRTSGSRR